MMDTLAVANRYAEFYETLIKETPKEEYLLFFDEHSYFEDPFQKVHGIEAIHKIFTDMYEKLYEPKFIVDEVISSDNVAYIRWDFEYALSEKGSQEFFTGVSRVIFSEDEKVLSHIDYWDAASHVYEKIPLLGGLLRLIKRKLHA